MSVLEYTGLGLLLLSLVTIIILLPQVTAGVRFWMCGWAAQIFTGPMQAASPDNPVLAFFAHGISVLFPTLLLAGAYCFVEKAVPRWLLWVGGTMAIGRGLFAAFGLLGLGRMLALPAELLAYALSAYIIWAHQPGTFLQGRLLPATFIALFSVELFDAFYNDPSRAGSQVILPWVIVLVATGLVQIFAWLEKHRAEADTNTRSAINRFDALAKHSRDVIAEVGSDGRLVYVSPNCQTVLGIGPEQVLGARLDELTQVTQVELQGQNFEFNDPGSLHALVEHGPYDKLYKIRHPDGASRFLEIDASHYFTTEGDVRAVAVVRDVTVRLETEQRAVSHQKLESLGVMAAGIAHDFRNLLTAIRGSTELLQFDLNPGIEPKLQAHFSNILKGVDQASGLTEQLLTYAGKAPIEIDEMDLNKTLNSMRPLLKSAVDDRAVLAMELAPDLPPLLGNPVAIQQIVINLVTNAVEAMENRAGSINIETKASLGLDGQQDSILLIVKDDGKGMDEHTKARIFEPFYSTKFTGRGLGLAALQGLVAAHKGTTTVDSFPGKGTVFTISLPCA